LVFDVSYISYDLIMFDLNMTDHTKNSDSPEHKEDIKHLR